MPRHEQTVEIQTGSRRVIDVFLSPFLE